MLRKVLGRIQFGKLQMQLVRIGCFLCVTYLWYANWTAAYTGQEKCELFLYERLSLFGPLENSLYAPAFTLLCVLFVA